MMRSRLLFIAIFAFLAVLSIWLIPRFARPNRVQLNLALLEAVRVGNTLRVRELLAQGADVNSTPRSYRYGDDSQSGERVQETVFNDPTTPLMEAFDSHNMDTLKVLLEHGANPDVADIYGNPLLVRAGCVDEPTAKILLAHGANINVQGIIRDERFRNSGVVTILSEAVNAGDVAFVRFLITHGANVHQRIGVRNRPLLFDAVAQCRGRTEVVKILLEAGAAQRLSVQERTSLLASANLPEFEKVYLLLKKYIAQH